MAPARLHGVERIVGHARCNESLYLNETILATYLKESRIFSRNELENRQVDSKYIASISEVFQIILQLALRYA
jgi:hypothetical protein